MDYHASDFTDQVSKLDQTKPICVYCASGGRSRGAMEKMKSLGFSEVYNLMGGFRAWQASGFSIENK
jgi:rhodanese-related sulfurtransferase